MLSKPKTRPTDPNIGVLGTRVGKRERKLVLEGES